MLQGLGVQGAGFRVQNSEFKGEGSVFFKAHRLLYHSPGFGVWGLTVCPEPLDAVQPAKLEKEFGVWGLGFGVLGFGFWVLGFGFRV